LPTTWWRLGVVAAYTELPAGYKLSNSHCRFCGLPAAITPNRSLCAGILSLILSNSQLTQLPYFSKEVKKAGKFKFTLPFL